MTKNYIAIDLGATSGRVILSAVSGSDVKMQTLHRFATPLVERSGRYFWDFEQLVNEIKAGLQKASGMKIESIGVDTWGVDVCPVYPDGSIGDPRAYRDPYTVGVPEKFFSQMPREELYRRTGIQIMNFNTVFQVYAQKGELDGVSKLLFMPDAISYALTGNMVCEYTILSTSAMMDPRTREFDCDILSLCGVDRDMFADRIVLPGALVGTLKPEYGLGPVPVKAVAGHDTGSAVAAVPADTDDFAYLSSGTWSLMGIETAEPVISSQMASLNYTNEGGATGNIRLLKNITGMWLLEQCLVRWRAEGKDYTYSQLAQMALESGPSVALIDPDDAAFASPTDMPVAIRRKFSEIAAKARLSVAALTDAQLVRLIYDSLAAKYAEVFHNLEAIAGRRLSQLNIIGGGCQNELLDQMTADACGVKVVAGPAECTALGNVMIQAGLCRSDIFKSIETKTFYPNE